MENYQHSLLETGKLLILYNNYVFSDSHPYLYSSHKFTIRPSYIARLQSFVPWPKYLPGPTPKELASAGFTYTGIGDKVICHNCSVKLHSWEVQDDAVKEHYKHSPHCDYIKIICHG